MCNYIISSQKTKLKCKTVVSYSNLMCNEYIENVLTKLERKNFRF